MIMHWTISVIPLQKGKLLPISKEAYKILKVARKEEESFSDVILRLFQRRRPGTNLLR